MQGIGVQAARSVDRDGIRAVVTAAFGPHASVVVPLIEELRRTGAATAEHVAVSDDEIVGHVLLSRGRIDTGAGPVAVDVLSPLAVLPSRQRQGIGRALIEHAIEVCERSGVPAVFLEGDPAYYARRGFLPAARSGFRSPSPRIPEAAFQVRLLAAHEPWMTGALVYPEAFWTMHAIGPS